MQCSLNLITIFLYAISIFFVKVTELAKSEFNIFILKVWCNNLSSDGLCARNELIEANLRVIITAIDRALVRFQSLRNEGLIDDNFIDDLIQDSNLALLEAAPDFDLNKGKFSTFVYSVVWKVVKRSIHNKVSTIRIPEHLWEKIAQLEEAETKLAESPTEEAAEATKLSSNQVNNAVNAYRLVRTIEIDEQIEEDANVGNLIADQKALEPLEIIEKKEFEELIRNYLRCCVRSESQRKAIYLRYRLDRALADRSESEKQQVRGQRLYTYKSSYKKVDKLRGWKEVAEMLGVGTHQAAQDLANNSMKKLKNPSSPRMLQVQQMLLTTYLEPS